MKKKIYIGLVILSYFSVSLCFASKAYTVTDLGHLGGNRTHSNGINNVAQVVGSSYTVNPTNSKRHAFFWENGVMSDLNTLPGGFFSAANAINDYGQVVGLSNDGLKNTPVLWQNGEIIELESSEGHDAGEAIAINNSGEIVGYSVLSDGSNRAVIWKNSIIFELQMITGSTFSRALGINDSGQVVGGEVVGGPVNGSGEWRAVVWDGENVTDLGIPDSVADDINNTSQIVGHLVENSGGVDHTHPFLWENDVLTDLRLPDENNGEPRAINNYSQIVGFSQDNSFIQHAILWENGTWYYLYDLIPQNLGIERLYTAYDINDRGQIVAQGIKNGLIHAFLLTPAPDTLNHLVTFTPNPSTYSFTADTNGCPSGFVGKFGFDARLTNSGQSTLTALNVQVATLSNGNLLLTSEGTIGKTDTFSVPSVDDYSDDLLNSNENLDVPFNICLQNTQSFKFLVDVLGVIVD